MEAQFINTTELVMERRKVVKLNVGGTYFEASMDTLHRRRNTMLARLDVNSKHYRADKDEYFFDRDAVLFWAVLDFYRYEEMHFPHNFCGAVVRRELEYWGVNEKYVAPCCWHFFKTCKDNEVTNKLLFEKFDDFSGEEYKFSRRARIFGSIWNFLEDPASSSVAKLYSYWIGIALILSIFVTILSNAEEYTVPFKRLYVHANDTHSPGKIALIGREPIPAIFIVDVILVTFFLLEFIVRAVVCPRKRDFFTNTLNLVEILAVLPKVITHVMAQTVDDLVHKPTLYVVYCVLVMCDIFRVLRLLKFGKYYVGLRILIMTLQACAVDMFFLVFLVVIAGIMFGVLIFYCELLAPKSMLDMPTGAYWAFITMATVGYGDVSPVTVQGRCVAVVCALAGVLFTGLAVPIIANSFHLYYSTARLMLARHQLGYSMEPEAEGENDHVHTKTTLTAFRKKSIV